MSDGVEKKTLRGILNENKTIIIAITSLVIAFTGVQAQDVYNIWENTIMQTPDYEIKLFEKPEPYTLQYPLTVSNDYYIEQIIDVKSSKINYGDSVKFSIKIVNRGKKECSTPNIQICIIDYFNQVWASTLLDLTLAECEKGVIIQFNLPPSDQKIYGSWRIFSIINNSTNPTKSVTVSYAIAYFIVEEKQSQWVDWIFFSITFLSIVGLSILLVSEYIYWKMDKNSLDLKLLGE